MIDFQLSVMVQRRTLPSPMRVLEDPSESASPVGPATVVLIRVDPLASVKQLDDDQVRREVATLASPKVLALYEAVRWPFHSAHV